jgi:hypothetical protein
MPVAPRKVDGRWRVVEPHNNNKIATNRAGTPVDGHGHSTREGALRQARAINANLNKAADAIFSATLGHLFSVFDQFS